MTKAYLLKTAIVLMALTMTTTAVAQKYHVSKVSRERILVDSRYAADAEGEKFLAPYKHSVDSVMSPVVGKTTKFLKSYAPESELSNLLADIMVWCGERYNERPDIGVYNTGGIRAALPKGDITFGDIVSVAPFDNKICFFDLTGEQVLTLCRQITKRYAAVLSHGMVITVKDKEFVSATFNGEPIDPKRTYRIATLDYLAGGNDNLSVLSEGKNINSPQDEASNTRFLITEYFREKLAKGEAVDANIEGRVIVE